MAFLAAAVLLCACGCGQQTTAEVQTTETPTQPSGQVTINAQQEDLALPVADWNDSMTAQPTDVPATVPEPIATEPAPVEPVPTEPAPTEAAVPSETAAPPATERPTETTTQGAKKAELLPSAVLAPINSGTYTMTVSAFLKDNSKEDQLKKFVRSGDKAYRLSIPSSNLDIRLFSDGGKYYLVASTQYCELTKAQFDELCGSLGNYFPDFSQMKYQKTETSGKLLNKTTTEYFDYGGKTVALQYDKKGALTQIESDGVTLPFTVKSGADSAVFSIPSNATQVEYADMEFIAGFFQMV